MRRLSEFLLSCKLAMVRNWGSEKLLSSGLVEQDASHKSKARAERFFKAVVFGSLKGKRYYEEFYFNN